MYLIPAQKQMCVCYSTIGINSFNVLIFSLVSKRILFNFEMFQLSEDHCMGFLLSNFDCLILNQTGIQLISLGDSSGRQVKDFEGQNRFVHSLGACNFLKIEEQNNIFFSFKNYADR